MHPYKLRRSPEVGVLKTVTCIACGVKLSTDEVALNQRLLGMQIGTFHCISCLAKKLNTTRDRLEELMARFKEMGCAYFTRLTEESGNGA